MEESHDLFKRYPIAPAIGLSEKDINTFPGDMIIKDKVSLALMETATE
jgi:hypothetical protein